MPDNRTFYASAYASAAAIAAGLLTPGSAMAGDAQAQAAPAPAQDGAPNVADIIVTANKRAENLQKVPISIAAFTAKAIDTQGIKSVVDLPQLTPGLGFTRTLVGTNAFLRGVGTTSAGYSTESPIATYVDGLYMPNSAASSFSFNNIERIEVLKGPQGTLYGRNTTGGLIHVITKEPGDVTAMDTSVSYGNYNTVQANFYGSTPLSDTVAVNLAALYVNQADGWGRNQFTGKEAYTFKDVGVQGKIRWQPAPDTKITLRGFFDKVNTDQGNAVAMYPGSVGTDGSTYVGKYQINTRLTPFAQQRQYSVSLKAEQGLGFANLTSITGYIDNASPSLQTQGPVLGQPLPGQGAINLGGYQTAKTFSQELQLTSNNKASPFQWMVGAFYYHDNSMIQINVYGTCIGAVCTAPLPTQTTGYANTRSYAGFAEGTYSFTHATRLTLGLRYTSDQKTLTGQIVPLAGFPNSIPAFPAGTVTTPAQGGIATDVTFNKLTWKAVLAQDLSDRIHAYASYNRGFKSGGFNPTSFTNPASKPEVLDAFEVGMKSELFDRKLRLNLSGFYYDYKGIQLRSTAPPAPPGGSILFNAAAAHIKGIDADLSAVLLPGLSLDGGFEVLDAHYSSFPSGVCTTPRAIGLSGLGGTITSTCNLAGFKLPQAPDFSATLGLTYRTETRIGRFEFNANDGYKSSFVWEPDNRLRQGSYHLVNASLTWTPPGSRFSLQAYGRNLGKAYYFVSGANGGGNDGYVPGAPRTYGVKARYQF
ncbi:TonB-dependent receptor [Novosphingobium rosa]|uniref:TonB-dependent receptor n=1 Tax=Novosphingobium rosa TaxID=76978 RepID=UPI000834C5FA|nr:TonB-dependent receptor [Novosphingobium rosa]